MSSRMKQAVFLALITAVSFVLWYTARTIIWDDLSWAGRLLSPLAPFILLLDLLALYLFIVPGWRSAVLAAIVVVVPYGIALGAGIWQIVALAGACITGTIAVHTLARQRETQRTVAIMDTLRLGIPPLITGLLILMAGAFIYNHDVQSTSNDQELAMLFERIVHVSVETTLGGQYFDYVSPTARAVIEKRITSYAAVSLAGEWQNLVTYMPIIAALALFFVLRALGFIYLWLAVPIGMVLYRIAEKTNFVRYEIAHKEVKTPHL